ncbi:MAG TPA: hypothetical protein O0X27_02850 [Methanocorpusculum sp.]|nr:hypothetical protein [Methanocorpusculum sp.]
MITKMRVPYFRISLALAVIWFIAGIVSAYVPELSANFVTSIIRILSSGIALALCFHAASANRDEMLYKILTFAIACVFLNDIYCFAHYMVVGATLDYFIILLPYLGAVSFMATLNFTLLRRLNPVHRYLPLLAVIPALGVAYAFWAVGHTPIISILYAFIICVTAYTIAAVLGTKQGKKFLFLEICIIVNAVLGVFWVHGMSTLMGDIMVEVLEILFIIAPLMYLPALAWGLKKCQ